MEKTISKSNKIYLAFTGIFMAINLVLGIILINTKPSQTNVEMWVYVVSIIVTVLITIYPVMVSIVILMGGTEDLLGILVILPIVIVFGIPYLILKYLFKKDMENFFEKYALLLAKILGVLNLVMIFITIYILNI